MNRQEKDLKRQLQVLVMTEYSHRIAKALVDATMEHDKDSGKDIAVTMKAVMNDAKLKGEIRSAFYRIYPAASDLTQYKIDRQHSMDREHKRRVLQT